METFFPFNQLLKNIIDWAAGWEKIIHDEGRQLSSQELDIAARIGIKNPECVRVLIKEKVPVPPEPTVVSAAQNQGLNLEDIAGITFGYGIVLLKDRADDVKLLTHEMVHVGQYEKLGFENFLKKYIKECLVFGYNKSFLEKEAVEIANKIHGQP